MPRKPIATFGDWVEVTPAYQGGGHFAPDGSEGIYTVVGVMLSGNDFYLLRGKHTAPQAKKLYSEWDIICHASRIKILPEVH